MLWDNVFYGRLQLNFLKQNAMNGEFGQSGNIFLRWGKVLKHDKLFDKYDHIIAMIVNMSNTPDKWSF
jgi:hypothetical protein